MQMTLWGEPEQTPTAKKRTSTSTNSTVTHTAADCAIYGHDWQLFGFNGVKRCKACQIIGYCPGCVSTPVENAHVFYCSRHMQPTESQVQS
jgi:hypothetical protein